MSYGEAVRQVVILSNDPASMFAAERARLKYPVSREFLALADLIEITAQVNGNKGWRYPGRPTPDDDTRSVGNAAGRSPEEMRALLRAAAAGQLETEEA